MENNLDNDNNNNNIETEVEDRKIDSIRKTLFVSAIAGIIVISSVYLVYSFWENKHAPVVAKADITKDREKCRYVGKSILSLTQKKGAEIYATESPEIAKSIAEAFKNAETTSNMIREKGKFTAFVTKNGECSIDEKNCSINVGMSSTDSECVFYLDEESGIQPSMNTAEFIKEETTQE